MKKLLIKSPSTVLKALKQLKEAGTKCLIVIDKNNYFCGTLSDGDLRKSIISGKKLKDSINGI